jgi:DNA-binding IclR family transcriptional regulator
MRSAMRNEPASYRPVNSLLKGLKILELFTPGNSAISFHELTSRARLPKATISRFLQTLMSEDYLSFDATSKKYSLGPRTMSLGLVTLSPLLQLREVALPYLEELSNTSGQTTNLAMLDGAEVVYIEHISKWELVSINIGVGHRINSYQTSSGRAILAFLSEARLKRVLGRLSTDGDAVKEIGPNGNKLRALLEKVRRQGYALNDREFVREVRSIAAPIFNARGEVEASINMPVFSHRVGRKELIRNYLPLLLTTALRISVTRGFTKAVQKDQKSRDVRKSRSIDPRILPPKEDHTKGERNDGLRTD